MQAAATRSKRPATPFPRDSGRDAMPAATPGAGNDFTARGAAGVCPVPHRSHSPALAPPYLGPALPGPGSAPPQRPLGQRRRSVFFPGKAVRDLLQDNGGSFPWKHTGENRALLLPRYHRSDLALSGKMDLNGVWL